MIFGNGNASSNFKHIAIELVALLIFNGAFFWFAAEVDLLEFLYFQSRQHEESEIDELFALSISMGISLTLFSLSRWYDLVKLSNLAQDMAMKDQLTGIYNRRALDSELSHLCKLFNRYHNHFALVLFDLDDFKQVNDKYGHPKGDDVLIQASELLKHCVRETDIVGRWGGEEFLILCPATPLEGAHILARKIMRTFEQNDFPVPMQVTASFGATSSEQGNNPETLIQQADQALYMAKAAGKNRVVVYRDAFVQTA